MNLLFEVQLPLKIFTFFIGIFTKIFLFLPFFIVASDVDISIVVANVVGTDDVDNIVGVIGSVGVVSIVSIVLVSNGVVVCGTFIVGSMDVIIVVGMVCTTSIVGSTFGTTGIA